MDSEQRKYRFITPVYGFAPNSNALIITDYVEGAGPILTPTLPRRETQSRVLEDSRLRRFLLELQAECPSD